MKRLILLLLALLTGCVAVPDGIQPVSGFQPEHYLGRWYEIARLDHSFERGMSRATADYRQRDDGGLDAVNRGCPAESRPGSRPSARPTSSKAPTRAT